MQGVPELLPVVSVSPFERAFSELLDARWVITTMLALYAALLSTFNTFIKDWWIHRPRIRVAFYESVTVGGPTRQEWLTANVVNEGYQPRKFDGSLSFQIKEHGGQEGNLAYLVTSPMFTRPVPPMLAPSDSFTASFPRALVTDAAREANLHGGFHVRAMLQDGTNQPHYSKWLRLMVE